MNQNTVDETPINEAPADVAPAGDTPLRELPAHQGEQGSQSLRDVVETARAVGAPRPSDAARDVGATARPAPADDARVQARRQQRNDLRPAVPRVDVLEDAQGVTLFAELPGVPRDQIDLKIDAATLTIDAVAAPRDNGVNGARLAQVRVAHYRRAFTLGRELDPARIEAQLGDGVLRLRIPRREDTLPRRIRIG